jgi:hypothetical protein
VALGPGSGRAPDGARGRRGRPGVCRDKGGAAQ